MPIMSVDVECVATGYGHNDHSVCRVAVVDENERVLLNEYVKPEGRIASYLTPITGVREGDLDDARSLETVLTQVYALLSPDVTLVGQKIAGDIGCHRSCRSVCRLQSALQEYELLLTPARGQHAARWCEIDRLGSS